MMKRFAIALVMSVSLASAAAPTSAQVSGSIGVHIGPPAPIVERVPPAPGPNYYWQPGWWRWNGVKYLWRPGAYAVAPFPGAHWVPGHWVQGPNGWHWRRGHWA